MKKLILIVLSSSPSILGMNHSIDGLLRARKTNTRICVVCNETSYDSRKKLIKDLQNEVTGKKRGCCSLLYEALILCAISLSSLEKHKID